MADRESLLVELFVEELPPKALKTLGASFADSVAASLQKQGLAGPTSRSTPYATPRRLAVHIADVASRGEDHAVRRKLMPVAVGLDAAGNATPPLLKRLAALGADASAVPGLVRATDGKQETLYYDYTEPGATLADALQQALQEAIAGLPIPKVMTYQLQRGTALPGWDSVQFVRPAHGLIALHGADIVPVQVLGLDAGRVTRGHRFEASCDPIEISDADAYADILRTQGAVIVSFDERRNRIKEQLEAAAAQAGTGLQPVQDDALLDEVTALVERPNTLVCSFDPAFLEVPHECLILTMKANQKYFPLLDGAGKLDHHFLVVSNVTPADPSAIIEGNQRVVRARLADARFFYDQDRKKPLASRVKALAGIVYHNRLGSQLDRTERVRGIARAIAARLRAHAQQVDQAALLAKADLTTGMVGEFPELQGVMGRYYAQHDGLPQPVCDAIEDHYRPRFSGDKLPRGEIGSVVALADKLETLIGLFGIGELPTGDKDPFALRRHAFGILRMLLEQRVALPLGGLLDAAQQAWHRTAAEQQVEASRSAQEELTVFLHERLAGLLREQGYETNEVAAVLSLAPEWLDRIPLQLDAVRSFARLPEAPALAAANKRIFNILKKSDARDSAAIAMQPQLLREPAEQELYQTMLQTVPQADAQFDAGDYTASLQTLARLRDPVDRFFDQVMVNVDDAALRANRLRLLADLRRSLNRVADLSLLAS